MPIPPRRIPHPPASRSSRSSAGVSPASPSLLTSSSPSHSQPTTTRTTTIASMRFAPSLPGLPKEESKLRPGMYVVKKGGSGKAGGWDLDDEVGEAKLAERACSGATAGEDHNGNKVEKTVGQGDIDGIRRGLAKLALSPDGSGGLNGSESKYAVGLAELIEDGKGKNRAPRQPVAQSLGFSVLLSPANNVLLLTDESDDPAPGHPLRNTRSTMSRLIATMPYIASASPGIITKSGTTPELSTSFGTPRTENEESIDDSLGLQDSEEGWESVSRPTRALDGAFSPSEVGDDTWVGIEDDRDEEVMFFEVDMFDEVASGKMGEKVAGPAAEKSVVSQKSYARALRAVISS